MAAQLLFCWLNLMLLLPAAAVAQGQNPEHATHEQRQQLQQQLSQSNTTEQRLELLVRLAEVFVTQDPALSLSYAEQWLNETTDRESTQYFRVLLQQTTAYMLQGQYQQAYQISLETERLARKTHDQKQLFNALRRQADNLNRLGQADKALPKALDAMQIAIDINNPIPQQIIRYELAYIYLNLYAYPQAIQIASEGLQLAMSAEDTNRQANFLQILAEASQLYQQYENAEDFARKALQLRLARQEIAVTASYHISLARSLLQQQKYQESTQQLELALAAAQQVKNNVEQADALLTLAWLDLQANNTSAADAKYQQIRQLLQSDEQQANLRLFSLHHLSALLEFNQLAQASTLYKQLDLQQSQFSAPQHQLDYLMITAKLAQFNNDTQTAYQAATQALELQQKLFDDRLHKQALVIASEQHKGLLEKELQQTAQQKELTELNYQHQRNMLMLVSVGALLALALLLSLFYHKSKRNKLLLQKQQELAQQKIAVKNEFIATLGHEIRTPLQGIDAVLSQLLMNVTQQDNQQKLQLARRAVRSLDNIINNILTSSRLDHGVYQPASHQVILGDLLAQLHDLLEPLASNKGLKLSCSVAPAVPPILLLDENLLSQLLTNLISNAVKYTEQGEIEVRVDLLEQHRSELRLAFKVRDTGVGLTALQISQLLRGERLNQQRALQAGPGLGMLVCQKLLQQVGSALQIQSVQGMGTEVSFEIKCQVADLLTEAQPDIPEQATALVIEDDELCRVSLEQMLTQLGFTVTTVSSLQQIQQLPERIWGWVFLDGQLEDADACQSIQQLRAQQLVDQQSRFILVSGSAHPTISPYISASLMKPWRREQLQALIAQLAQLPPLRPLYQLDYLQQTLPALTQEQSEQLTTKVSEQLQSLQLELSQSQPDSKLFHRMIGCMGQLGLTRLSQLCQLAEHQLQQQDTLSASLLCQLQLCLHQSQQATELLFASCNQSEHIKRDEVSAAPPAQ